MLPEPRPRVSFAVPVYNEERAIRRCLDSLLAQSFQDFEIVVCDNASTDRTREILAEYVARDPRVRVFANDVNIGLIANFNRVFELTRGELFRWVGADDWLEPEYTSRCVAALDANPAAIVATAGFALHDADGGCRFEEFEGERLESASPARRFARMLAFLHGGATRYEPLYSLMRREVLARTHRIRPMPYNDYVLVAELSLAGQFVHVPQLLFHRCFRTPKDHKALFERLMPGGGWALGDAFMAMAREVFNSERMTGSSSWEEARAELKLDPGTVGRCDARQPASISAACHPDPPSLANLLESGLAGAQHPSPSPVQLAWPHQRAPTTATPIPPTSSLQSAPTATTPTD
jgi:glycosyltransferase involved in cell wall biosynthesis